MTSMHVVLQKSPRTLVKPTLLHASGVNYATMPDQLPLEIAEMVWTHPSIGGIIHEVFVEVLTELC